MEKQVWLFTEGRRDDRLLLGNKGANLCEMTSIGLPVPFGFILTTRVCADYARSGRLPDGVMDEVWEAMKEVEQKHHARFGDASHPLLVSVRSGAPVSMPGMMDTVLNLGLNETTARLWAETSGNPRFVYDAYRRFIQMYGDVVEGMGAEPFEEVLDAYKSDRGFKSDLDLSAEDLQAIAARYREILTPPDDPREQLERSIEAVFRSWNNNRAKRYRRIHDIPESLGTGVIVQAMVYGNRSLNSGTGVAFTRNPATGERLFYGEYLMNAEGEDVVAGIRTPEPLETLKRDLPDLYAQLFRMQQTLEMHYRDMQDLEFTIEEGKLWMLQTRTGKRTPKAAVKIAVDMVEEGLIKEREALKRINPDQMDYFLHPMIDPKADRTLLAKGLPASPGAATGRVVFSADDAEAWANRGEEVILVRRETTPEDIHGMKAAKGLLTALGGMTSHAAVVARGMGKCCIAGCGDITVDAQGKRFTTEGGASIAEGEVITLDGTTGEVMAGTVATVSSQSDPDFQTVLEWADRYRRLRVRANAETPEDAAKARELGAEGIGLCRTEHMFFDAERIDVVRAMILADTTEERQRSLDRLRGFQKSDMRQLFEIMSGLPVTIRLLDPPLHEFLPQTEEELNALAGRLKLDPATVQKRAEELKEVNPMLGLRGCRLSVAQPEITRMQVDAILSGALEAQKAGHEVHPEIMIPLTVARSELDTVTHLVRETAEQVFEHAGARIDYQLGTMMETPRACLRAEMFAEVAEFFSFGTNDLTQMTYGFSRDDVGKFLPAYLEQKILENDPFAVLDQRGVGALIMMAIEAARKVNPTLHMGICGEHGGEPRSIRFCHEIGFDYVSCSPYRIPIARIAAAQALL